MAISTIGTDALAASAVTTTKLASGVPSRSQLPAGTVLQVVNSSYGTITASTSATYADSGLAATITPTSSTSKILVFVSVNGCSKSSASSASGLGLQLFRNSTFLILLDDIIAYTATTLTLAVGSSSTTYLDSPATTSATTYKIKMGSANGTSSVYINNYINGTYPTVSTITLMEIAA